MKKYIQFLTAIGSVIVASVIIAMLFGRNASAQSQNRQHVTILFSVYDLDPGLVIYGASVGGPGPAITNYSPAGPIISILRDTGLTVTHVEGTLWEAHD